MQNEPIPVEDVNAILAKCQNMTSGEVKVFRLPKRPEIDEVTTLSTGLRATGQAYELDTNDTLVTITCR